MTEVTQNNYKEFIQDGITVVDIWSPTCGPCLQLLPILEDLSTQMVKEVSFGKLNAQEYRDLALELKVRSIPTLLFYKDGILKTQTVGLQTADKIKEVISSL